MKTSFIIGCHIILARSVHLSYYSGSGYNYGTRVIELIFYFQPSAFLCPMPVMHIIRVLNRISTNIRIKELA